MKIRPMLELAGGGLLAVGVIGASVAIGGTPEPSTAARSLAKAPILTITLPASTCAEDDPCWSWSTMGNRRRGVLIDGVRVVVSPCGYRKLRIAGKLDPATPRLRGDAEALKNGCGAGARVAVHSSGVVEG